MALDDFDWTQLVEQAGPRRIHTGFPLTTQQETGLPPIVVKVKVCPTLPTETAIFAMEHGNRSNIFAGMSNINRTDPRIRKLNIHASILQQKEQYQTRVQ